MSTLIVDPVQQQEKLALVGESMQHFVEESEQVQIDRFLDSILSLKGSFIQAVNSGRALEQRFRELFELAELSEEKLAQLDDILTTMDEECTKMRRIYIDGRRFFDRHKLAKTPIREYGETTNDLKEVVTDLRLRFFNLPQDDDFQDLMRELGEIA